MSNSSELVCNLWALFNLDNGVIYAVAGKVYALDGTKEQKLSILKKLSAVDHRTVDGVALPRHLNFTFPFGEIKSGMTDIQTFHNESTVLFEELFHHLENKLPKLVDFSREEPRSFAQKLPTERLCVQTLVAEDAKGYRRSITTDEDRLWLQKMGFGPLFTNKEPDFEDKSFSSLRPEIRAYINQHIDMARAISEQNIYSCAPEQCDTCESELVDDGFFVDAKFKKQTGWACMCMECFGKYGENLGPGVGQLYQNQGKIGWLQVAGF